MIAMDENESNNPPAAPQPHHDDDAHDFALDVAAIARDLRTEEVAVLDLRGISSLTDFFVIGTGTSERQMSAVFDRIQEHAKAIGRQAFKVADTRSSKWMLADYVDVVIHLFDEEHRAYYDLDGRWGDAPRLIDPDDPEQSATPSVPDTISRNTTIKPPPGE